MKLLYIIVDLLYLKCKFVKLMLFNIILSNGVMIFFIKELMILLNVVLIIILIVKLMIFFLKVNFLNLFYMC